MLTITLIALILAIPLSSISYSSTSSSSYIPALNIKGKGEGVTISATLYTRIVSIGLLYAGILSYNAFPGYNPTSTYSVFIEETVSIMDAGLGLYSGLIHTTTVTQTIEVFLFICGALILLPWAQNITGVLPKVPVIYNTDVGYNKNSYSNNFSPKTEYSNTGTDTPTISEYPILILFTTIGASFLLASADLVSIYLAIELQSFGVYILAAVYRDSEGATAAGLKYFLLGALSSSLILLGSALVYAYTGLTALDSIYELMSVYCIPAMKTGIKIGVGTDSYWGLIILGFIFISVGLLFKVAAAPFHYWAPDVYDGTPTIVTTWLTVIPKISIFIFILSFYQGINTNISIDHNFIPVSFLKVGEEGIGESIVGMSSPITIITTYLLLICTFLSLVIGTVGGLGQYRIKRLLAYSTISHVGFLLLALSVGSVSIIAGEESTEAFLFYIIQYTLTNINAFFVLLAFGYVINGNSRTTSFFTMPSKLEEKGSTNIFSITQKNNEVSLQPGKEGKEGIDINFTSELVGQFRINPVLGASLAICLFSIAGVPPLVGFFAKYTVLYSAIHNGYTFLAIVSILASVVSAVYYLRIIRVIHFDNIIKTLPSPGTTLVLTSVHSYIIAVITLFILTFAVYPTLILNSTSIMALSIYVT